MLILGLSAFDHDSAAVLIKDGHIMAAAEEERFTRRKHDNAFPSNALAYCLAEAGACLDDLDAIAFFDDREPYVARLREALNDHGRLVPLPRSLAHAASAFYPSPFDRAAVLVTDDITVWGKGTDNHIALRRQTRSFARLYTAFTRYLGFKPNSGEYKVMGLAPYGRPVFAQQIQDSLALDVPEPETLADAFGQPPRKPESALEPFHQDLAASIQYVTERALLDLVRAMRQETGESVLCMAGALALNCAANAKIAEARIFDDLWIQPASGNAGAALGAALAVYHQNHSAPRPSPRGQDAMQGALLGPAFEHDTIVATLREAGTAFDVLTDNDFFPAVAALLAQGKTVGWFQGRMEFGPRALGNRSILSDPRLPDMQRRLNASVKFREPFRPFAPSVLAEDAASWFETIAPSPYMLLTVAARDKHALPAVTHTDGSARVQTVDFVLNQRFHTLLEIFKKTTGCGVLLNTSFNVRGEPLVCSPQDALRCFLASDMDALAIGNCLLHKDKQPHDLRHAAPLVFDPD